MTDLEDLAVAVDVLDPDTRIDWAEFWLMIAFTATMYVAWVLVGVIG